MFNSFLDGTKSAIEMAAVSNASGLRPPEDGLKFPPAGVDDLAERLASDGPGYVEVISSLNRDGSDVDRDLRWGVYVVLEAHTEYAGACFKQYGLRTDPTGRFAGTYKPYHLIGMELSISIYSAALRGEATGFPAAFRGDPVAIAKRDLAPGDRLDGEGGFTVWGKLIPARRSIELDALPIGLAKDVEVVNAIPAGQIVRTSDVVLNQPEEVLELRNETLQLVAD